MTDQPELALLGGDVKLPKKIRGLYAMPPGTGPEGETCGSCKHVARGRRWSKCGLCRARWTHAEGTDVRLRTPACSKWERMDDE